MMDDGEVDFSEHQLFSDYSDLSMDNFLDELLKNTHSCTHTHTCNPPGPDNTHTHTCFHTHTQLFAPFDGKTSSSDQTQIQSTDQTLTHDSPSEPTSKRQPLGNREAVRKYREKKKAQTAYLEEQVMQLKVMNQQLLKKLQGQAALEAEVVRLRSLLSEFRGRIDAEIGQTNQCSQPVFRVPVDLVHQKPKDGVPLHLPGGYHLNSCNVPCEYTEVPCFHSEKGPSTPQDYSSLAGGSNLSCEVMDAKCSTQLDAKRNPRLKRAKTKD